METLKYCENPDFLKLRDLVRKVIRNESIINPNECMYPQAYPSSDELVMIEYLLRKNCPLPLDALSSEPISCEGGEAISPAGAARCLRDFIRTSRFITGLYRAIKEAQKKFRGEKIRVSDVGCGPWALLSVAAATQFSAEEVEFSLVDVHPQSVETSRKLIKILGMEDYFGTYIDADAAKLNLAGILGEKPHIIVAEVMNAALMDEPQAAVTKNLVPQMETEGIWLPEKVIVAANLISDRYDIRLGNVIEFTKEEVRRILEEESLNNGSTTSNGAIRLSNSYPWPDGIRRANLALTTDVRIFDDLRLHTCNALITRPYHLGDIENRGFPQLNLSIKLGGDRWDAKYSLSEYNMPASKEGSGTVAGN